MNMMGVLCVPRVGRQGQGQLVLRKGFWFLQCSGSLCHQVGRMLAGSFMQPEIHLVVFLGVCPVRSWRCGG